jgi:FixJ family two-component response regulator
MTRRTCAASVPVGTPVVYVVDKDAWMRESLELLIRSAGWTARTFASGWQFLVCPRVPTPGCLIADATLTDPSGLELQQRIADRPEVPIIFVTCNHDVHTTVQAMKAGAFDFMLKPFGEEVMLKAIASAIAHSEMALKRESELQALRQCHASLSRREQQVMALVVQGLANKLIGAELGITEITVKAHRGNVMRKMQVRSLPELVTIAVRLRSPAHADAWIEPRPTSDSNRLPRGNAWVIGSSDQGLPGIPERRNIHSKAEVTLGGERRV